MYSNNKTNDRHSTLLCADCKRRCMMRTGSDIPLDPRHPNT